MLFAAKYNEVKGRVRLKTIIYANPTTQSYNQSILNTLIQNFEKNRQNYQVIDLYRDKFNPVLSAADRIIFDDGKTTDQKVRDYQEVIKNSTELYFIFPIWWYDMPAILKGFMDKVLLNHFAYQENTTGHLVGLLQNINQVDIITTSTATQEFIEKHGNFIRGIFIENILPDVGIPASRSEWIHFGKVNLTTDDVRKKFLADLPDRI